MNNLEVIRADEKDLSICPTCNQKIEKKIQRDDIRKVVTVFKMASGYEKEDKSWDKVNYSRCAKLAKLLVSFLGSWENAADCIQDIYEKFSGLGFTVTFETILKHSADWKRDRMERSIK